MRAAAGGPVGGRPCGPVEGGPVDDGPAGGSPVGGGPVGGSPVGGGPAGGARRAAGGRGVGSAVGRAGSEPVERTPPAGAGGRATCGARSGVLAPSSATRRAVASSASPTDPLWRASTAPAGGAPASLAGCSAFAFSATSGALGAADTARLAVLSGLPAAGACFADSVWRTRSGTWRRALVRSSVLPPAVLADRARARGWPARADLARRGAASGSADTARGRARARALAPPCCGSCASSLASPAASSDDPDEEASAEPTSPLRFRSAAARRTRSACGSTIDDEGEVTPMPSDSQMSRTSPRSASSSLANS